MAQIFHRSVNTLSKVSIFGAVFIVAALAIIIGQIIRSPYVTEARVVRVQPVPFSHEHHVGGLAIDCRYCHTSVENSSFAGIPPTKICMNCHSQIWNTSAMLEPVRNSFRTDESIRWIRVHDLPDYVYFNHSIHVAKGIGCVSCHGRVDRMPLMRQAASPQMEWCLDCHRHPERAVRPRAEVFHSSWTHGHGSPPGDVLVGEYRIRSARDLTSCSTCH